MPALFQTFMLIINLALVAFNVDSLALGPLSTIWTGKLLDNRAENVYFGLRAKTLA